MSAQALKFPSVLDNPTNKKEMLGFFRQAITKIASINLINVRVETIFEFKPDSTLFRITVSTRNYDNTTFDFYDFFDKEEIARRLGMVIKSIRTDDFLKIADVSRDIRYYKV